MEALLLGDTIMSEVLLKVRDFSLEPFGRYSIDGDSNGEDFRKKYIVPALNSGNTVAIDLDGINDDYDSSFLVEAFANLIRKEKFTYQKIKDDVRFISQHPEWIAEIEYYIEEVRMESQGSSIINDG